MTLSVYVGRKDLAIALRTLAKFVKRKQQAEAVVSFADGTLQIELPGGLVGVPADGEWSGEVRVPGSFFVSFAKTLPDVDPLPVQVRGDRFYLAGLSVRCVTQGAGGERIQLPLDPPVLDVLRVRLQHSEEEIERSGLTALVRTAEEKREQLIMQAHSHLHQLGVTRADLDRFVDECLLRRSES
jgi:hypothetical protein